ncbi:unnamed protein product, partial [Ascophyllum nodosum]
GSIPDTIGKADEYASPAARFIFKRKIDDEVNHRPLYFLRNPCPSREFSPPHTNQQIPPSYAILQRTSLLRLRIPPPRRLPRSTLDILPLRRPPTRRLLRRLLHSSSARHRA